MASYELLEGSHVIQNEPVSFASKGDIVESDRDLVAVFGKQKFKLVEGEKKPEPKKGGKAE
jgi:hypothetical protein